jgi:predicted nucleic acid-binding protein
VIITPDSGILVRATVRSNGPARRLIDRIANDGAHVLAISPFVLGEVGKALAYSKLQTVLRITPDEVHAHLARLRRIARVVEVETGLPVVLNDPKDDLIFAGRQGIYLRVPARSKESHTAHEQVR